jgi:hypothetical protein
VEGSHKSIACVIGHWFLSHEVDDDDDDEAEEEEEEEVDD